MHIPYAPNAASIGWRAIAWVGARVRLHGWLKPAGDPSLSAGTIHDPSFCWYHQSARRVVNWTTGLIWSCKIQVGRLFPGRERECPAAGESGGEAAPGNCPAHGSLQPIATPEHPRSAYTRCAHFYDDGLKTQEGLWQQPFLSSSGRPDSVPRFSLT